MIAEEHLPEYAHSEKARVGQHDDQADEQEGEVFPAHKALLTAHRGAQVQACDADAGKSQRDGGPEPEAVADEVEIVVLLADAHAADEAAHQHEGAAQRGLALRFQKVLI